MRRLFKRSGGTCARRDGDVAQGVRLDTLERRLLLAADPAGLKQAETETRISAALLHVYEQVFEEGVLPVQAASAEGLIVDPRGRVSVTVRARNVTAATAALRAAGFRPTASYPKLFFAEGTLPIRSLPAAAKLGRKIAGFAMRPTYDGTTLAGSVTSEGDVVHAADRVRGATPDAFNGNGVTVGVLSDSFNRLGGAAADIGSGDLPAAGVRVVAEGPVASSMRDEGRAMLQLVHDLAPGAALAFATGAGGPGAFANNIRALAAAAVGADVIVDDVLHFGEPMFQDGVIAQAIDEVVATRGVAYFTAAGNHAAQAYESRAFTTASDTLSYGPGPSVAGDYFDFNPSPDAVDTRQIITIPAGGRIAIELQWDDPFYTLNGVDTDLDLYLVAPTTGQIIAGSQRNNLVAQEPFEVFGYLNPGAAPVQLAVAIHRVTGPAPGRIKFVNYGERFVTFGEFATHSPAVVPHAAAASARAVGAVPYYNPDEPEPFTSSGPATILFSPTGARLASPQVRQAPQLAGVDQVNTTFFGGGDVEGDGRPNFAGTSAAAAHVAGVAALLRQANPSFSPADVYDRLEQAAADVAEAGFDTVTGHGLVNAYDAVYPGPPRVTAVFVAGNAWTPAYFASLQVTGEGEAGFGYRIDLQEQARTVGWSNLNQISMRFGDDVALSSDALTVAGVNVAGYPVSAFAYDPATFTATWTLGRSIPNDTLRLSLGGETVFTLRALPGDVNRDGTVDVFDYNVLRANLNQVGKGVGGGDLNGDHIVDVVDLNLYRVNVGRTTPA